MSGRIPHVFIDDLLVRVDIVDLINSHVPLKKTGSSYVARCPFHTEKSPSFSVNRVKQFYHCFGCGAGGNAISFLMNFSHLSFVEAVEDLAGFVGVDVPRESSSGYVPPKQNYSDLYAILEKSAIFFAEQLRNHPEGKKAVEYLKQRGLSGDVAKAFSLGYAPNEWDALASQFDHELLLKAGMLTHKESGKTFDRFRGRLMFPIRDKRQRVIGFGGRVLDEALPKYLNSPETPVFSKGKELYGLFELLEKNPKPKQIMLVEGYMDVLALSQFGIDYSVAALGTAASKIQLDLLFRFTPEIVFCFDGDVAGQKAAWRAVQEVFPCLRDGRQARVMILPEGDDPDSLIRQCGVVDFEQQIQSSHVLSDYFFQHLCQSIDLATVEGKAYLISKARPCIEKIPVGAFREMMTLKLNELSGQSLKKQPSTTVSKALSQQKRQSRMAKHRKNGNLSPIRTVITLLLQNPSLIAVFEQKKINLVGNELPGVDLLKEILHIIEDIRPKNSAVLLEQFRGKSSEKVVNTLMNWDFILDQETGAEFSGALDQLVKSVNEETINKLIVKENSEGLNKDEKNQLVSLLALKE